MLAIGIHHHTVSSLAPQRLAAETPLTLHYQHRAAIDSHMLARHIHMAQIELAAIVSVGRFKDEVLMCD